MILAIHSTKVVVHDLEAAERFYQSLGLKLVNRNLGGEKKVRQQQSWLSVTGDSSSHMLILSQFLEVPAPAIADYPGNFWLVFNVTDVDAICEAVGTAGGEVLRAGEDRREHGVRAAVVADPEGHIIEIVGPMSTAKAQVNDLTTRRT